MDVTSYMLGKQAGGGGGGTSYTAGTNIEITNTNVINNTIPYENGTNYYIYGEKKSGTTVTGNGVAVGSGVTMTGVGVSAFGNNTTASGNSAVVIGNQAKVNNVMGIAIGALSSINANRGIAIGTQAETYNADAIAIGNYSIGNESNVCIMGSMEYNINKLKLYTSNGKKELATQDYVDNAISTAITSALGGSY